MATIPPGDDEVAGLLRELIRLQGGSPSRPKVRAATDGPDPAVWQAVVAETKRFSEQTKKSTSASKAFGNILDGSREDLSGFVEGLSESVKDLDEALQHAVTEEEIRQVEEAKREMSKAASLKIGVTAASNFAGSMLKAGQTMLEGSRAFELAIQSGASGIAAGTDSLINSIEAQTQVKNATVDLASDLSGLGVAVSMLGGPWVKAIGLAISVLGPLIGKFFKFNNEQEKQAQIHRAKLMGEELKKTEDTYKSITAAGAMFAGGMGEMRAQAAAAGMTVKDFGNMVKNSVGSFANMGMGVAQAAQRIGGVTKVLRTTELGTQLRNLGLNAEEQGDAAASAAAALNSSGQLRTMSDSAVAQATVAYTKDLKILQGITGEDAKKKLEEAQKRSMEADLLAKAMAQGGPEAVAKLQKQLATMPETMKKGYMEFVSTGGSAIADAATNVAISQNPKIMEQYQQMYRTLGDGSIDASAALLETGKLTEQTAEYARTHADAVSAMATAARLGASELGKGAMDIHNSLILANQQFAKGVTEATAENVKALQGTKDPITNAINKLAEETNTATVALETRLTPELKAAADALPRFTGAYKNSFDALLNNKNTAITNQETAQVQAAAGQNVTEEPTDASQRIKSIKDMGWFDKFMLGSDMVKRREKAEASGLTPEQAMEAIKKNQFARGGIAKGPDTGFAAMLHGTEAVVPLPDGKSLPVNLGLGAEFTKSMQQPLDNSDDTAKATQDPKILALYSDMFSKLDNGTRNMDQVVNNTMSKNADTMSLAMDLISKVVPAIGLADKLISTAKENPAVKEATAILSDSFTKVSNSLGATFSPQIDAFDSFAGKLKDIGRFAAEKFSDPAKETTASTTTDNKTNVDLTKNITDALVAKSTSNDSILSEVRDLIKSQLSKYDEMIGHLKETADINQRLLNQSYS